MGTGQRKQKTGTGPSSTPSVPEKVLALCLDALADCAAGHSYDSSRLGKSDVSHIAHAAIICILQRREWLQWVISQLTDRRVRPRLSRVLWWAISQMTFMDGMAPAAITDTAVRYVGRRYNRNEAGFINAVLRQFLREGPAAWLERAGKNAPEHVRCHLPLPLFTRWKKRYDETTLRQLCDLLVTPASIFVRERQPRQENPAGPPGCRPSPPPDWAPDEVIYVCTQVRLFLDSEAFRSGRYYIQDPSTLLAPRWLAPRPGETVADLCAAPGGKAAILLESLEERGRLVVMDRSPHRMHFVSENLGRTSRVQSVIGDAACPPFPDHCMSAVLLDVPCSNTGVIRRRPDVSWHDSDAGRADLVCLQRRILDGAARLVTPGGRLVYSTCSLEPEENTEQVHRFLAEMPVFQLVRERQLLPSTDHDGAYAALLQRDAS